MKYLLLICLLLLPKPSQAGALNNLYNAALTSSPPTISSCGGGTLVTGSTGNKGQISGISAGTTCTITFNTALSTAPACTFTASSAVAPFAASLTTGAATVTMTALTGSLYYICF